MWQNSKNNYIILGVCATSPCGKGAGLCLNNDECEGEFICGSDSICSEPCSVTACDLDEGKCHDNDQCKDALICGSDMICKGKTITLTKIFITSQIYIFKMDVLLKHVILVKVNVLLMTNVKLVWRVAMIKFVMDRAMLNHVDTVPLMTNV